jgi:hypothetical protein
MVDAWAVAVQAKQRNDAVFEMTYSDTPVRTFAEVRIASATQVGTNSTMARQLALIALLVLAASSTSKAKPAVGDSCSVAEVRAATAIAVSTSLACCKLRLHRHICSCRRLLELLSS